MFSGHFHYFYNKAHFNSRIANIGGSILEKVPLLLIALGFIAITVTGCKKSADDQAIPVSDNGIQIYSRNPMYWQYNDKPIFLFGGSSNDNLFQNENLIEELDVLHSLGGNFVRGNMSWRDEGNVKPYKKVNGLYDLNQFNDAYWQRFATFVRETEKRGIIIQMEIWPTVDFHKFNVKGWLDNPFNPAVNSNYTAAESGLPAEFDYYHWEALNPFFETVPGLANDNAMVRAFQEKFIEKVLSYTLKANNVIYGMDNENYSDPRWGQYWIAFVRQRAAQAGKRIYAGDMFDEWDNTMGNVVPQNNVTLGDHPNKGRNGVHVMFEHPEIYDYIDVSNNGAQFNEIHYATLYWVYRHVHDSAHPRPINVDKIYGGPVNARWTGGPRQGAERFWRNLFAGLASARFHRPVYGNGLSAYAQKHVKSMAMLLKKLNVFDMQPDPWLVAYKGGHEIYALANAKEGEYALLFLDGGDPNINTSGQATIQWLDILNSQWRQPRSLFIDHTVTIAPPDAGFWVALIKMEK